MLELDLAISPFSHLAARAAYKTTRFKVVNNKLVDKFRSRLIPSVHLEILKRFNLRHNFETYGHRFESFVKRQFGMAVISYNLPEAYHYYVDAVTHPNMSHKQLKRYANSNVMAICHKMWCDNEMAFPVLADALEDQDFPDLEYLNHLRTHPQFSRANFVLQFFLNRRIGWPRGMRTSHREVGPAQPMVWLDIENRQQYQMPAPEWFTTAEREQMLNRPVARAVMSQLERRVAQALGLPEGQYRGIVGGPTTEQNELDALRYSFLEQMREQEFNNERLGEPHQIQGQRVTMTVIDDAEAILPDGSRYPLSNVQIQERPDDSVQSEEK